MSNPTRDSGRSLLPSLTGLRFLAAFVVFAYHTRNMAYFSGHGQAALGLVFGAGPTGVSLFFVLSGFVLAWSDDGSGTFRAFWLRRAARIVPTHLVVLALALLLAATILPSIRTADPWAAVADGLLVSSWNPVWWQAGNPVSWSLVCEAFFYAVFPLLIRALRPFGTGRLLAVFALAVGGVLAVAAVNDHLPAVLGANSSPLARLPEFVVGIALARLLRTGAWRGPSLAVGVLAALAGYAGASLAPTSAFTNAGWTVIGYALLIAALARCDIEGRRTLLASRPLVRLGDLSFAFYLVHVLVLQSIGSLWPGHQPTLAAVPAALLTLAALGVAVTVALLLNRVVERPGRRLLLALAEGPRPAVRPDERPVRAHRIGT
ncbi:O-acetyltransferase OatA [Frondihabitans sp. 762G35]|uniref:acyltransferase family protein n=1 Tax=Frondihabitans sp. 762G35 TaxID=1446794 RepID=UPI000D1FDFA3|nr:acyltransferase [Frondihabitans sp. 762G35]ARC55901.1 O-acetyltransferase OatA [Frondihabitans sp. 762G35]